MLSPTLLGVIICVAEAVLEGALAGEGVRQRLTGVFHWGDVIVAALQATRLPLQSMPAGG
jgi:hypothetical protein